MYRCYVFMLHFILESTHVLAQSCPETLNTKKYVESCPMTQSAWDDAAAAMNCSAVKQSCTSPDNFLYHCLPNSYQSKLIEVCAIPTPITFPVCAEYNEGGNIVTENHYTDCHNYNPPCPNRYPSTEAYKYSQCYIVSQQSTTTTTNTPMKENTSRFVSTFPNTGLFFNSTTPAEMPIISDKRHAQLILSAIVAAGILLPAVSIISLVCMYSRNLKESPAEENTRMV